MLIPNASEIARRKWTVRTISRALSLALVSISILPIVSWLAEGFMDGDTFELMYYADRIALAIFCIIIGIVAWFMQGLITRILVPIPKGARCPKCNHNIAGMTEPVCTECGLELTPEFLADHSSDTCAGSRSQDPRITPFVIANRRAIVSNIFRVIGVFVFLWGALSVLGSIALFFMSEYEFFSYAVVSLVQSVIVLLISIVMIFWSARLARFCVISPPQADFGPPAEIEPPKSPTTPCGDGPATG